MKAVLPLMSFLAFPAFTYWAEVDAARLDIVAGKVDDAGIDWNYFENIQVPNPLDVGRSIRKTVFGGAPKDEAESKDEVNNDTEDEDRRKSTPAGGSARRSSSDRGGAPGKSRPRGRKAGGGGRAGSSSKRALVKAVDFSGNWQLSKIENKAQQNKDVMGNFGSVGKVFNKAWQRIGFIDYISGKTGQKITQQGDRFSIVHHVLEKPLVKYDVTAGGPAIEATVATGAKVKMQAKWAEKKTVLVMEEMYSDGHMHPATKYMLPEKDILRAEVGAATMVYKRKIEFDAKD